MFYGIKDDFREEEVIETYRKNNLFSYGQFLNGDMEKMNLTMNNSVLDLGDKGYLSNLVKAEKDESTYMIFLPPKEKYNLIVASYSECSPAYELRQD